MRKKASPTVVERAIALPSIKKDTQLPVILNRSKLKEQFTEPTL